MTLESETRTITCRRRDEDSEEPEAKLVESEGNYGVSS
jgi:hypothetical protein